MWEKIKSIWGSIRFRTVVLGGIALWLQDIVSNGFSWQSLLTAIAGILLATAGIGTVDKFGANFKKEEVINE
jgi:hypothetical protein